MIMNEEYWSLKRSAYACVCLTDDGHGSVTVWDTEEDAWNDAWERTENFINENLERSYCKKVYDGYEIFVIGSPKVQRYYKVFDVQELE